MTSRQLRVVAQVMAATVATVVAIQGYYTLTDYLEYLRREKAAKSIQKWFRNSLYCNYNFWQKRQCAIRIQKWWRKVKADEKYNEVLFTIKEKWVDLVKIVTEDVACVIIQTWWKTRKSIRAALGWEVELPKTIPFRQLENDETIKIQSHIRMRSQRQMHLTEKLQTMKVLSQTRCYLARRRMDELMDSLEKEIATVIIQSWWKMSNTKRWFSTQRKELEQGVVRAESSVKDDIILTKKSLQEIS